MNTTLGTQMIYMERVQSEITREKENTSIINNLNPSVFGKFHVEGV